MPAREDKTASDPEAKPAAAQRIRPARVQGIDQVWLINLDRRRDRLERFMQSHPEMFGRINRLSAYNGKDLQLTPALARLFAPNNFEWHKPTMGCAMSHLALWHKLAEEADENASYLILEDDAQLDPSWVATVEKVFLGGSVPMDWEVLFLGGILPKYRESFEENVQLVTRTVARINPECVFGSNPRGYFHFCAYAYLLNKRGARRLVDLVQSGDGIWMQADFFACYTNPELSPPRPVYFFHPLLAQSFQDSEQGYTTPYADEVNGSSLVDSDIWKERDRFSAEEVVGCESNGLALDIPAALGWTQNSSLETECSVNVTCGSPGLWHFLALDQPTVRAEVMDYYDQNNVNDRHDNSPHTSTATEKSSRTGQPCGIDRLLKAEEIPAIFGSDRSAGNAIAFCADRKFFPYASVAILSLLENGGCEDIPIFFFADHFEKEDIENFDRLGSSAPGRLHLVELNHENLKGLPSVRHMSRATFIRLWVPEILRSFGKILYLDSDILVVSELSSIFETVLQGKCVAAVRDLVGEKTCKIDFFRSGDKAYFNAGVLLIDTAQWRHTQISEKVLKLARNDDEREKLSAYADQCLLNFIIRGDFVELDKKFNWLTFEPKGCSAGLLELAPTPTPENLREAKILHFVGGGKPWMPSSTLGKIWPVYEAVAQRSPWYKSVTATKSPADAVRPSATRNSMKVLRTQKTLPSRRWDYVSPNLVRVFPDEAFPQMVIGDVNGCGWPYLRREIPHNWYIDRRTSYIGFATRDEASILFNTALEFAGKRCLEIGCWMGWSAAHILMAGTELDIIDPVFENPVNDESVRSSLAWAAKRSPSSAKAFTHAGFSPAKLVELAAAQGRKWDLAFIDGDHEGDGPLRDAQECEKHLQDSSIVLFHDLSSPFVAKGLNHFRDRGWNTRIYNTMQIMGVAWRGNVSPVDHQPDPQVQWEIPEHLEGYEVSDFSFDAETAEFERLYRVIKPFTMLGSARLLSLYRNAMRICRENIPGDFVECGACRGGSAALLAYVAKTHSKVPRKVYACDTFEGMPEPGDADRHRGVTAAQCGFPAGSLRAPVETGLSEVTRRAGVADTVVPVKGLFRETLPVLAAKIGSVSLLHADGDWYESTMDIFCNLFGKVPSGGYVQIDDYGHWEGCRKAVEDYQKAKNIIFALEQIDYTGFGFRKA